MLNKKMIKALVFSLGAFYTNSSFAYGKIALIIGNSNYEHSSALKNPINDAADINSKFLNMGYETIFIKDGSLNNMNSALDEFSKRIKYADVAVFYYAGHGIQASKENYLVPVDFKATSQNAIADYTVSIKKVINKINESNTDTKIIIIDACRNNPFFVNSNTSIASRGLTRVIPNESEQGANSEYYRGQRLNGLMMFFSAAPGQVAYDGNGRNSFYTKRLLENIDKKGLNIVKVFANVNQGVLDDTNNKQETYSEGVLNPDFYFLPPKVTRHVSPTEMMMQGF